MKIKNILIGAGLLIVGYETGKVIGCIKCVNSALDVLDEAIPGSKKDIVKKASDKMIDKVFKSKEKELES